MKPPEIRIAFWGTPALCTIYLTALEKAGLKPVVIVTNPDRPKGRGQEIMKPEPKIWGLVHDSKVLQPEILNDAFYEELASYKIALNIVIAYGSILPQKFIDMPTHGTLNIHYSLLPNYRGAFPIEAAILSGDKETGVSIQIMARALDSGPIVAESKTDILPDETATDLRWRLTSIGADVLIDNIRKYVSGELTPVTQEESRATTCGKMQKEDGFINLADNGVQNYRKYRAYFEWPRTYFFVEQKNAPGKNIRVIITKAHLEGETFVIDMVLPEGKKEMKYEDFKRGYQG